LYENLLGFAPLQIRQSIDNAKAGVHIELVLRDSPQQCTIDAFGGFPKRDKVHHYVITHIYCGPCIGPCSVVSLEKQNPRNPLVVVLGFGKGQIV